MILALYSIAITSTENKYGNQALLLGNGSDCSANESVPPTLMNVQRFANEIMKRKGYHLLKCAKLQPSIKYRGVLPSETD